MIRGVYKPADRKANRRFCGVAGRAKATFCDGRHSADIWEGYYAPTDAHPTLASATRRPARSPRAGLVFGGRALELNQGLSRFAGLSRILSTTSQWDADPWSLNTPNGVIDLKTGEISEHQPHDYFTKLTAVGPADGGCPTWQGFLNIVTANDLELQHFMLRLECFVVLWSAFSPFVRFCPVMKRLPILSDSGTDFDRTVDDLLGVCG